MYTIKYQQGNKDNHIELNLTQIALVLIAGAVGLSLILTPIFLILMFMG